MNFLSLISIFRINKQLAAVRVWIHVKKVWISVVHVRKSTMNLDNLFNCVENQTKFADIYQKVLNSILTLNALISNSRSDFL